MNEAGYRHTMELLEKYFVLLFGVEIN